MQFPNKLYPYKNSTLALMPMVLREVKERPISLIKLYQRIRPHLNDATDFLAVMDCLYALQAADVNDEGEVFLCLSK